MADLEVLEILYEDKQLVAVNKPAGLLVHRSRVDIHADSFAVQTLRDQLGKLVYPVHRIDRPTSGVLLFALDKNSARLLSEQFAQRTVKKTYMAIVRGHTPSKGRHDEPLVEKQDRMTDQKAKADKAAQDAVTDFRTIDSWTVPFSTGKYPSSRYSLVEAKPLTGRKHQLRRHFNHMAYPIVGDTTYGDRRHNRLVRECSGVSRLLLVSTRLEFANPTDGGRRVVVAPVGDEFEKAQAWLNENCCEPDVERFERT